MILSYLIIPYSNLFIKNKYTVIILHGLFGNKKSLYVMGKFLNKYLKYKIILLDIRNHGLSISYRRKMDYIFLSQDVLDTLDFLNIKDNLIIIGHSMGGKIAMKLTQLIPHKIKFIVILDIAPIKYKYYDNNIFTIFDIIYQKNILTRKKIFQIMKSHIKNVYIINVLLKSFKNGKWNFNLKILKKEYKKILDWNIIPQWNGNIFFLKAELSNYINFIYYNDIFRQFPFAKIYNIPNVGHLLHIENEKLIFHFILKFFYK
ncbi:alpha/beta fold hydrolase [Enterobacteriaceae endosymbiont of Donacia dentata]|uniref:alpha/beta fold hydrolase n=1 Tax=Enterobacteriaceae endosymbiont of Donacia dentata TaxID=2675777 RepID=UPI0014492487|nr:alpha/beta fold hydrolase [Enterobacteriaceae endosymbiont of Donacia dentata]QJC32558.1 alpha/beta fold hydrolase [Enterobacteriaceae endosymbiont of Donacia dentata]